MGNSLKIYVRAMFLSILQNVGGTAISATKNRKWTSGKRVFLFLVLCSLLFVISGCGYSLHRGSQLPFREIAIGTIENKTVEPKLQDKLSVALTQEFLKQGVTVTPAAPYTLSGVINTFELKILSEKSDVAAEYEVVIQGDFRLNDPSGKISEWKTVGSPFIVSFPATGQLNELIALKEEASLKAMRDTAGEIVATILYQ
ncbi:MAG: LptE family protein [Thermodesulfovibrionales bacterium]|nr:LptE family protein [Thermodesulfovibrionales bacterium]